MDKDTIINILINTLAFIVGMAAGMAANMLVLQIGGSIIPPPEGLEFTKEWFLANRDSFPIGMVSYVVLAHIAQAFVGAMVCSMIARSWHIVLAFTIILLTLIGGIMNAFMVPPPTYALVIEMLLYIPVGLIGYVVGINLREKFFVKKGEPYKLYEKK